MAPCLVVMGVSGCGKSTVGQALAHALGLTFVEGDQLHPPRNVALMASGVPLTDADREGWLHAVGQALGAPEAGRGGVVVSCSALKRSYRDLLRAHAPGLRFIHLQADPVLLARRLALRKDHYMPASLLQSQLDTLEPPHVDERAIVLDGASPLADLVVEARRQLESVAA